MSTQLSAPHKIAHSAISKISSSSCRCALPVRGSATLQSTPGTAPWPCSYPGRRPSQQVRQQKDFTEARAASSPSGCALATRGTLCSGRGLTDEAGNAARHRRALSDRCPERPAAACGAVLAAQRAVLPAGDAGADAAHAGGAARPGRRAGRRAAGARLRRRGDPDRRDLSRGRWSTSTATNASRIRIRWTIPARSPACAPRSRRGPGWAWCRRG